MVALELVNELCEMLNVSNELITELWWIHTHTHTHTAYFSKNLVGLYSSFTSSTSSLLLLLLLSSTPSLFFSACSTACLDPRLCVAVQNARVCCPEKTHCRARQKEKERESRVLCALRLRCCCLYSTRYPPALFQSWSHLNDFIKVQPDPKAWRQSFLCQV